MATRRKKARRSYNVHGLGGSPDAHMKDVEKFAAAAEKSANNAIRKMASGNCGGGNLSLSTADMQLGAAQYAAGWASDNRRAGKIVHDAYAVVEDAGKAFSRNCIVHKK